MSADRIDKIIFWRESLPTMKLLRVWGPALLVAALCLVESRAARDLPGVLRLQVSSNADFKQQLGFKPADPDRGYVKDCSPGGTYFNFSWTPKEINPTNPIRFDADIISPIFFDKGKVEGSVFYEGNPMISMNRMVSCEELSAFLTNTMHSRTPFFTCPLQKGLRLQGSYVYPNTEVLVGYDGNYKLEAKLYNEKGEQILCVEIDVTVLPY